MHPGERHPVRLQTQLLCWEMCLLPALVTRGHNVGWGHCLPRSPHNIALFTPPLPIREPRSVTGPVGSGSVGSPAAGVITGDPCAGAEVCGRRLTPAFEPGSYTHANYTCIHKHISCVHTIPLHVFARIKHTHVCDTKPHAQQRPHTH